MASRYFEALVI